MQKKTFITIAVSGGKILCNPFACFCETHDDAHEAVSEKLGEMFGQKLPSDTTLTSFDVDQHVIYVGELPPEMKEETENEDGGCKNCRGDDAPEMCQCPRFSERCDMRDPHTNECKLAEVQEHGAAPKLCADPAHDRGENYPEEGRVYKAEELLFAIGPYGHMDQIPGMKFVVHLTIAKDFEMTGYQTDDLGGHNVDNEALRAAGLNDAELMESVFEVVPYEHDTREELAMRLLDAGFGYRQSFQDFIDKSINRSAD